MKPRRSSLSMTMALRGAAATVLALLLCATARAAEPAPMGGDSDPRPASELTALPVNVSFVPPLSVNALYRFRTVHAFALNVLVGNSGALGGLELSGIGSRDGEVRGAQIAGVANWVDAGAYGQTGDARGAQVAGVVNWTGGSLRGVQTAGVLNHAGGESSGAQVAGVVNAGSVVRGFQLAGVSNVAGDATVQLAGVVNFASDRSTVQAGVVNVTRQARGAQIGVVNVAEDADVSVGVFSWIKNGTHDATLAVTEYGLLAAAETGGRSVYGILTAGTTYGSNPRRYLLGLGIGWRALASAPVLLDVQAVGMQMVDADALTDRHLCAARAIVALRVAGPVSVFAGPTFNAFIDSERQKIEPVAYGWKAGSNVHLWPGFLAGLRVF